MRIGLDIGGSKLEGAVLDDAGTIVARERVPSVRGDYDGTIEAVAGLVARLERAAGRRCTVGIGIPGTVSRASGLVKNANSTWLIGRPFDADISARLDRPVRMSNDANCFALSEAVDGAAAGARSVFGVILGTGVGGGIVLDGRVVDGPNGIAGEWGHNPLPWPMPEELPGHSCYCGKTGCLETFLSGPGLAAHHRAVGGETMSAERIAERAAAGDPACEATLRRHEDRLARGIAGVINVLDPEVIVLGGGLSNLARLYENVPALLPRHVFSDTVETRLVPPRHGAASGVRGAAWLWPEAASD